MECRQWARAWLLLALKNKTICSMMMENRLVMTETFQQQIISYLQCSDSSIFSKTIYLYQKDSVI